jgi:GAF domain-containing protein
MTTVSAERLARIFVEIADTLVDEFDLIDFLHMLAVRTADLVHASAVGLVLADPHGRLEFMAASDENAQILELFQVQNREGPCFDAFRTGRPVVNADLADAGAQWPRFAPRATAAGFHSVHAFPLRLRSDVIGALNVFGAGTGRPLDDADTKIVQALTDVAAIGLLQERAIRRGELLTEQLQGALNSRIVIEQAKGAIAQAWGVNVNEAFAAIRDYARAHNRRTSDVAHAILTAPASLPGFTNTRNPNADRDATPPSR